MQIIQIATVGFSEEKNIYCWFDITYCEKNYKNISLLCPLVIHLLWTTTCPKVIAEPDSSVNTDVPNVTLKKEISDSKLPKKKPALCSLFDDDNEMTHIKPSPSQLEKTRKEINKNVEDCYNAI